MAPTPASGTAKQKKVDGLHENNLSKSGPKINEELGRIVEALSPKVALLISDKLDFERMTVVMREKSLVQSFEALLIFLMPELEKDLKVEVRILISAFMIVKHPEVLNCDAHQIRSQAQAMLQSLSSLIDGSLGSEMFIKIFCAYSKAFQKWQHDDLKTLKTNIQSEVTSVGDLMSSIMKQDDKVKAEWAPHVESHKAELEAMLDKLEELKITTKSDGPQISNVQIAHDLFLEGPKKFDYFKLYMPEHHVKLDKNIGRLEGRPTSELLVETLGTIKKALLGMVPTDGDTFRIIDEGICIELHQNQIHNGSHDYTETLSFIVETMSRLCAPIRDDQISAIRVLIQNSEYTKALATILRTLSVMSSDEIMFGLSKAMPHLPSIIVQYERDAFAGRFKSGKLPNTEALVKRIYKRPDLTARDLANELILLNFFGKSRVLSEMLYLDQNRLDCFAAELKNLSISSCALFTTRLDLTEFDPAVQLIHKRMQEAIEEALFQPVNPGGEKYTKLRGSVPKEVLAEFDKLLEKFIAMASHHFKVF